MGSYEILLTGIHRQLGRGYVQLDMQTGEVVISKAKLNSESFNKRVQILASNLGVWVACVSLVARSACEIYLINCHCTYYVD